MQEKLRQNLIETLLSLEAKQILPEMHAVIVPQIERTRDAAYGDFATNIALILGKELSVPPRELATQIVSAFPTIAEIEKIEIAGPGFINFYLTKTVAHQVVKDILDLGVNYGCKDIGLGRKVNIEFVSANPTGPLHVGHGRGAAYGAVIANLLAANGFKVHREYYVNDAGRQMHILAVSVWMRYLELGVSTATELIQPENILEFPNAAYKGDYVIEIARFLHVNYGAKFIRNLAEVSCNLPEDAKTNEIGVVISGDADTYIDALIERAQALLGAAEYALIFQAALNMVLNDIKEDLSEFGVHFESWFSEEKLHQSGAVAAAIAKLKTDGHIYESDGALWFRATSFSDEKDRVVMRSNGQYTYFAADIAYHFDKYARGFDIIIDVVGADHHGYAPRIKAVLKAARLNAENLAVMLVQFAILYRGKLKVQMSTRSGSFVTLRELRKEVGNDAVRFFYIMRKNDQHLDFDLDLAKSQSKDNPVYYVQYAHARICSVLLQLDRKNFTLDLIRGKSALELLTTPQEQDLLTSLTRYSEVLEQATLQYAPHILAHYLLELSNYFHSYYNAEQFLVLDTNLRNARLALIYATRQLLQNGLNLLGISQPESM